MALIHSFESSGNFLFKYRGQIPVILFIIAIPVIYITDYANISKTFSLTLSIISIILSVSGIIIRAISIGTTPKGTSGRNTDKQVAESLNITGIYSTVRHPLYLGNFLIWFGIVLFTYNIYFVIIVSLVFWLYYERIMFAEERFLEKKFGKDFLDWSLKVPAFIPSFKNYIKSSIKFSFKSILRREYSGILSVVFSYTFIDILRYYFMHNKIQWNRFSVYALIITALIALILRTLKHNTQILDEQGRS